MHDPHIRRIPTRPIHRHRLIDAEPGAGCFVTIFVVWALYFLLVVGILVGVFFLIWKAVLG